MKAQNICFISLLIILNCEKIASKISFKKYDFHFAGGNSFVLNILKQIKIWIVLFCTALILLIR